MRAFLEATFGPVELSVIDEAFKEWVDAHRVTKDSAEAELAAAIIINLYREGHNTKQALNNAIAKHRGLSDLGDFIGLD